nr:MAG TPA: hypothetical protein [Caudoviricetes sp.]
MTSPILFDLHKKREAIFADGFHKWKLHNRMLF